MNPRYLNYCRVNGNTPEEQMKIDSEKRPTHNLRGFGCFIFDHLSKFRTENPEAFIGGNLNDSGAKKFDEYLDNLKEEN